MFCTQCGRELPNDAKFCDKCGTPIYQAQGSPIGMNWHIAMQVILILGAVLNLFNALVDPLSLSGLFSIVLLILEIITIIALHTRKKIGPLLILILYTTIAIDYVSIYVVHGVLNADVSMSSVLFMPSMEETAYLAGALIACVIMIVVNKIYYGKRMHLFS